MKKTILLLAFFLTIAVPVTAYEHNRIGLGVAMAGDSRPSNDVSADESSKEPYIFYAPFFSYERIFKEQAYGFSTWEINVYTNPFENNCSLSFAVKFFLPDILLSALMKTNIEEKTAGWIIGLTPLSDVNFCNLFDKNPYLYYGVGCSLGYYVVIANVFDLEMKMSLSLGVLDAPVSAKMNFTLNIGYWF